MDKMAQIDLSDPGQVGLRILARWIAEDILKKRAQITSSANSNTLIKENNNANQRNQRSSKTTQTGKNPIGDQKESPGIGLPGANGLFRVSRRGKEDLRGKTQRAAHNVPD
jgi:hypothetical protein